MPPPVEAPSVVWTPAPAVITPATGVIVRLLPGTVPQIYGADQSRPIPRVLTNTTVCTSGAGGVY